MGKLTAKSTQTLDIIGPSYGPEARISRCDLEKKTSSRYTKTAGLRRATTRVKKSTSLASKYRPNRNGGEKGNGAGETTKPGTGEEEAGDRRWPRARAEPERGPETRGVGDLAGRAFSGRACAEELDAGGRAGMWVANKEPMTRLADDIGSAIHYHFVSLSFEPFRGARMNRVFSW
jgi:hypothetical protein